MAYLTQLDAQLLLFIHDALHHEPLHNFWAGISFLGDLGWFWIFTAAVLIINPKTRSVGIAAAAALLLSTFVSNVILKNAVMRPRLFLPQRAYHSGVCQRFCVLAAAAQIFQRLYYGACRAGCVFAPIPWRALSAGYYRRHRYRLLWQHGCVKRPAAL